MCRRGDTVVASANGPSVDVAVGRGQAIVCTISNTAKPRPVDPDVRPVLDCVLFKDGSPDVAYWGYVNAGDNEVTIRAGGERNRFSPTPDDRGQPDVFEEGRHIGVFQTPLQGATLVWHLLNHTATASEGSPACNPTVELRKVTIPADDPGVFQLRIDNAIVATGGNGTTSGPLRTGIGEGTVSETAAPGTSLADYDSTVECTRNGTVEISVPGTKVDGEVRRGDTVVCTFTNTRKGTPPEPPPADAAHATDTAGAAHATRHRRHRPPPTPPPRFRPRRPARHRCSTSSSPRRSSRRRSSSAAGSRGR